MALKGPNAEDIRKLHAEINQIVNQRFLLTTAALPIFGIVMGWSTTMLHSGSKQIGWPPIGASMILSLILCALVFLQLILKNLLRIYTSYLVHTNKSSWEDDFAKFRLQTRSNSLGYSRAQACLFLLLNALSFIYPLVLALLNNLNFEPLGGIILLVILGMGVEVFIYLISFRKLFDGEETSMAMWKSIASTTDDVSTHTTLKE